MDITQVLIRPLVTEKSEALARENTYLFVVNTQANKHQIAEAVETLFGTVVTNVRTALFKGKRVRVPRSRHFAYKSDWKKAMVTIKEGESLNVLSVSEE